MLFSSYQTPKGVAFVPPVMVRQLPLSLLQSSNVTRDPDAAAGGVRTLRTRLSGAAAPRGGMLPASFLLQQWKRGPGGSTRGDLRPADQGVLSYHAATSQSYGPNIPAPAPASVVFRYMNQAGGLNRMPPFPLDLGDVPISRMLPRGPMSQEHPPRSADPTPDQVVEAFQVQGRRQASDRARGRAQAMTDAHQGQPSFIQRIQSIVRGGR